ncbi:MAG TPA: cytochrome c [Vicinamibacterales bacterium]
MRVEAALVLLGVSLASTQAPQPAPSTPPGQAAPTGPGRGGRPPQALAPMAATTLAANPEPYVGLTVTVTAAVDQRYGGTAFSVAQDRAKSAGQDVLVLAPLLNAPVEANAYVTVIGEVVRFDAADAAARMKDAMPSLAPEIAAKYRGRAAIIATSVINGAMRDLAKRLPPPMSPEDLALSKVMKQVGPGFTALRQSVTASNAADTAAQAASLTQLFGEAAAFWKTQARPDAIQWTEDARLATAAVDAAAAKGDWDAVKAAVPKLQAACSSCHGVYRERLDDGTYRVKRPAGEVK